MVLMNKKEGVEIHVEKVIDAMNKIMKFAEENDIQPLVLLSACPIIEEFLARYFDISRKEIDTLRRDAKKIAQELPLK